MSSISKQRMRRNVRAKASKQLKETITLVGAAAAVLFVIWLLLRLLTGNSTVPQSDTFYDVYVNGIALSGYTYEEGSALVAQKTEERLNLEIHLNYQDKQWTITPSELGAELSYQAQISYAWNYGHTGTNAERKAQLEELQNTKMEFNSDFTYDEEKLDALIAEIKEAIEIEPVEAEVIVGADEMLSVTESKNGIKIDGDALKEQIRTIMLKGGDTEITIEPLVWEPESTTESAAQGTTLIASAQTSTAASSSQRTKNVKRALKPFDGYELKPGEVLNFNDVVGKRTKENGFYEADEYSGTDVVKGIGGGTCQASTTLYMAALKAGLTVVNRSPHSMIVSYAQPSLDAAVSDTGSNLVIQNDLEHSVYFYTSVDSERAEVKIYGTQGQYRYEITNEITQDKIKAKGYTTKKDTSGKYVYYTTDDPVLYEKGKYGCRSRGYRLCYDIETGELVDTQLLSQDYYYPKKAVYWVGVHDPMED